MCRIGSETASEDIRSVLNLGQTSQFKKTFGFTDIFVYRTGGLEASLLRAKQTQDNVVLQSAGYF